MVPLLIDENFNHRILRGLRLRLPELNYQLVQEVEVFQKEDPEVLDWATTHNYVVVTHDVNTMIRYAYVRSELSTYLSDQPSPQRTPQAYEFLAHPSATDHWPLAHGWGHRCRLSLYYGAAWQA